MKESSFKIKLFITKISKLSGKIFRQVILYLKCTFVNTLEKL